ncbi:MAG: hypothetical protein N2Z85_01635, partial [Patescibacteria group bacterium]|nr:hypothetical protein [Patescibacteria group bacterium]
MGEFLIIFFLSFIPRILFLFFGQSSITHDEADFFLNGFILNKTGTDFLNQKIFTVSGILTSTGGIPVYINGFLYNFFEKNIIFSRLPYVLLSIFTPVFFYYFLKKITNNKEIPFISFLIMNFSSWFSFMSTQGAIEQIPSLFFLIGGYYFYIIKNKLLNILSFIFLFLSFHSYMGIKIIFPLYIFLILITKFFLEKKSINLKLISKILLKTIIISVIFFLPLLKNKNYINTRASDTLIFLNKNIIENKVWYQRLTFEGPIIIKKIYSNKITIIAQEFIDKYLDVFNLKNLFLIGDNHPIYGSTVGLFYLWLLPFFILGIINLLKNIKQKGNKIIFIITIISPISSAVNIQPTTIALRSFPIIFAYSYIIALGIVYLKKILKIKKISIYFFILILFSFINFFYYYQSRIKTINSEQWHLGEKKLFEKILKEEPQSKKIYIVNNEPKETFMLFAFYHLNDA